MVTGVAPTTAAERRAPAIEVTTSSSSAHAAVPGRVRGGRLISRFHRPSSVVSRSEADRSSTAWLSIAGSMASSTRASSSSTPVRSSSAAKRPSPTMRRSASRQRRTFVR